MTKLAHWQRIWCRSRRSVHLIYDTFFLTFLHFRLREVTSVELCVQVKWLVSSSGSEQPELCQVCVVRSAHRGPVTAEYNVTGSTYAPEGIILDGAGLKVCNSIFCSCWISLWRSCNYLGRIADTNFQCAVGASSGFTVLVASRNVLFALQRIICTVQHRTGNLRKDWGINRSGSSRPFWKGNDAFQVFVN